MDPFFEIRLQPAPRGARQAAQTIFSQLREAIVAGRLAMGTRLPPPRRAKEYFGISRNTATEVYERLRLDGFISTRPGSGSYVAHHSRRRGWRRRPLAAATPDRRLNAFWLAPETEAALNFWRENVPVTAARDAVDLRPALIDSRLFPLDLFRQVTTKSLRDLERRPPRLKSPQGNQGNYSLREGIAKHLALTRAVACDPDSILVTAGAQQAFDIVARTLISPARNKVAVEDPGYPPLRVPFAAAGAQIVPVPVDAEGLCVEALPSDVAVICVCPSHQFPLGSTLSAMRRRALLQFARARGAVILEDDYDGEFRHGQQASEPLRAENTADVVIYVGTFSKCMLPSLRLGYLIAPDWALGAMITAKNALDWHCPTPLQIATAAFISGGHLARHVRRMRRIYEERRGIVTRVIQSRMAPLLEIVPSTYGIQIAAFARQSTKCEHLAAQLAADGVRIHSLDRYYLGKERRDGFVFGLGTADTEALQRGLKKVQEVLETADSSRAARRRVGRSAQE
jgi:GntR family transcriptional regulator/MocR family aminotransferase